MLNCVLNIVKMNESISMENKSWKPDFVFRPVDTIQWKLLKKKITMKRMFKLYVVIGEQELGCISFSPPVPFSHITYFFQVVILILFKMVTFYKLC